MNHSENAVNALEAYFWGRTRDEMIEGMNWLQNRALISDNAVWPGDVDKNDAIKAVEELKKRDLTPSEAPTASPCKPHL